MTWKSRDMAISVAKTQKCDIKKVRTLLKVSAPFRIFCEYFRKKNYFWYFALSTLIISTVMVARSYCGLKPHSSRAQWSSIWFGQESAMF